MLLKFTALTALTVIAFTTFACNDARSPAGTQTSASASPSTPTSASPSAAPSAFVFNDHHAQDVVARCPNAPRAIDPSNAHLVPSGFARVVAIATHACDAILWVYGGVQTTGEHANLPTVRLVFEAIATHKAYVVGEVAEVLAANYGGLYVPFEFSKNDQFVLFDGWMDSPGAGGGGIDIGYAAALVVPKANAIWAPQRIAEREAVFYNDYEKLVSLAESDKTPDYSQPGPKSYNAGRVLFTNLNDLSTRVLLEQPDTTYGLVRILNVPATNGHPAIERVELGVTQHTFTKDCPRSAYGALDCSYKAYGMRTLDLP